MAIQPKNAEVQSLPIQQLGELSRLNADELNHILRIFNNAGVYFSLYKDSHGAYALFLDKDNQIQAINAGIFAQCIGVFFGNPNQNAHELHKSHSQFSEQIKKISKDVTVPQFDRMVLYTLAQTLVWKTLQETSGLDDAEIEIFQTIMRENDYFLNIYFDQKFQEARAFYFTNNAGVPQTIESENAGQLGGFIIPQDTHGKQRYWEKNLKEEFSYYTGKNIEFVLPVRAQMDALIQEFLSQISPTLETKYKSPTELEQARVRLRLQLQKYLSKIFSPHGIEVLDAKMLASESMTTKQMMNNAAVINQFPVADLLFVHKNPDTIDMASVTLLGFQAPSKKDSLPTEVTPYGNVCGIVLVDDETSLSDRKKIMRTAGAQLRRFVPTIPQGTTTSPTILTVDQRLFNAWQSMGGPFATEEEITRVVQKKDRKKLADYGIFIKNDEAPKVELHVYEPGDKSHIGGNQLTLVVRRDEKLANAIMLDRGWLFDLVPAWSPLGRQPAYVEGIAPFLHNQMFDLTPRLYRTDLIVNSINSGLISRIADRIDSIINRFSFDSVDEFLLLEAFHRFGEEGFVQLLRERAPAITTKLMKNGKIKKIIDFLKEREQKIYEKKTFFDMLALTHAHQDHSIGSSFIRDEVVRGWSPITRSLLLADHRISANWYVQDTAVRKMREMKKVGASYPVFEYPYVPFRDGQRIEVSPGVFLTPIEVYHSIPGSMGFHLEVEHKKKKIASVSYGGDYRDARFFDEIGRLGGTDLLIVEGTNPPSAKKDSLHFNEEDVLRNFDQEIAQANDARKAVVVDLVKNGFERLYNIMHIAAARGRTIVLSPKIAQRIRYMQFAVKDLGGPVYNNIPNIPIDDPRIRVWKPRKGRYITAEKEAFELFQTISPEDVAASPQHYIVIRENEQPEKLNGIGSEVLWIDSTYGPYSPEARSIKKYMKDYAEERGWIYKTFGFHASGHVPLLRQEDDPLQQGVLAQVHKAKPKEILPIHTQKRGEVAHVIQKYRNLKNTRVRSRVAHPRYKIDLA